MSSGRSRLAERLLGGGQEPDPRVTLANERTFLAWIRTAMALLAGAIAVDAFAEPALLPAARTFLAVVLAGLGLLTAGAAGWRWLTVERALRHGRPLPVPLLVPVLALACVVLAAGLIGYPR
ncbi:YidH family protein [Pseudomonas sp. NY15437]|uniref:YidH family protein n=1 Tax=Pseudomonas sp. NY15437 TaxID=3400360 RepID=UPI003A849B0A